jgi:hypothetical protein
VTSVASVGDEFVAPQDSALLPRAHDIIIAGQDHFGLALSDRTFSIIRDAARAAAATAHLAPQQASRGAAAP